MLPFDPPEWIHTKCTKDRTIFPSWTYLNILEFYLDEKQQLNKLIEVPRLGYYTKYPSTMSYMDRTTYLIYLIELMHYKEYHYILVQVLKYRKNINFTYPSTTNAITSLVSQLRHGFKKQNTELVDLLIKRKEMNCTLLSKLAVCLSSKVNIDYVISYLHLHNLHDKKLYECLLYNHIYNEKLTSRALVRDLIKYTNMNYGGLTSLFFNSLEPKLIDFMDLVDWKFVPGYNPKNFEMLINKVFNYSHNYNENSHGLLQIYMSIVRPYGINLKFNYHMVVNTLCFYQRPEYMILMEILNLSSQFKNLIPPNISVMKYLQKRYKIRYGKYIAMWRHKTYAPGSKIHLNLIKKYSNLMINNPSSTVITMSAVDINNNGELVKIEECKDILLKNPFYKE